jgi:hypothetical protein
MPVGTAPCFEMQGSWVHNAQNAVITLLSLLFAILQDKINPKFYLTVNQSLDVHLI